MSGKELPYFAINIIGCVAAADLKKSDWINLDGAARGDSVFMDLVLDKDKLPGPRSSGWQKIPGPSSSASG